MKGVFSKLKKNKKGYTLTELIVVVAILGVLAAIAVPMILNSVQDSKDKADKTSISVMETAVQMCLAQGTLKMDGNKIRDLNGQDTDIAEKIRNNLKGNKFPQQAVDSTNWWKLDLVSGEITSEKSTINPVPGSTIELKNP